MSTSPACCVTNGTASVAVTRVVVSPRSAPHPAVRLALIHCYCPLPFYLNCTAIPTLNLNSNSALVLAWRRQHWLIVVLGVGSRVRLVQRTQSVRCDIRQHVWRGPSRRVSHSKQDYSQQVAGAGQYNADRRAVIDRRVCPPSLHLAYLLPESLSSSYRSPAIWCRPITRF